MGKQLYAVGDHHGVKIIHGKIERDVNRIVHMECDIETGWKMAGGDAGNVAKQGYDEMCKEAVEKGGFTFIDHEKAVFTPTAHVSMKGMSLKIKVPMYRDGERPHALQMTRH